MRVAFSAYGSRGIVEPIAVLAARLREAGAEVRVCAPPDEEFVGRLAEAGVRAVPVGRPVAPLVGSVAPGSAVGLTQRVAELMDAQFETVAAVAEGCDVLVATGPLPVTAPARSVAEKLGVRYVHASHQPVILPTPHRRPPGRRGQPLPPGVTDNQALWDLDAEIADTMFGEMLNSRRDTAGLPPVRNVRDYAFSDQPWLATDPVLSPWRPTALDVVQTGAWLGDGERPLPDDLLGFLESGAPPVYVGFGSTPLSDPAAVSRVAIEAVRAQGRRAVVFRGWAGLGLIDDQDDCFLVGEVDHLALFRRVAAVVHHGSAGTTTTAALAGAPQVVLAQGADQPYWAGRVADLGIGAAHEGAAPTFDSLSAALGVALSAGTRARAATASGTVRADGAAVAVGRLLGAGAR
ncbi:glycosyl transferase [Streptomyces sp. WAC 01529]|uniref:glycosyltransferase n=1 Tax=Streptomyces sp. WAC 01529 TaxID=2203205 RepID=UPI000F6CE8C3|nr:glycosyltransferase [Streptomyces sp. WAC 01529]AZM53964.1 glycosyl transferase [Streptomyces sp. WAC 01529]